MNRASEVGGTASSVLPYAQWESQKEGKRGRGKKNILKIYWPKIFQT